MKLIDRECIRLYALLRTVALVEISVPVSVDNGSTPYHVLVGSSRGLCLYHLSLEVF